MLAMSPPAFWRSTPADISALTRGARWRERRAWERVAWLASTVISPHVKHVPPIKRMLAFLGPEEGAAVPKPPEDIPAFLDGIAREHKKKAWALLSNEFAEGEGKEGT